MEIESHLIDVENHIFKTKVDLFKKTDQLVGFKVMCYDRVVECHFDENQKPTFNVRRLEDDDRPHILKEGFNKVGQKWTEDEIEELINLFESEGGDLLKVSEKMERTEKGIRLKLRSMGLIDDEDQKMDIIETDVQPIPPKEWTEDEVYKLRILFDGTNGDIKKVSKALKRTEKSVRMKLFFLDLINEDEVIWMEKG
ncbi:SANT/Myb-like DNA-binding domain-containing protein [Alphaproteobacteria bacterium]|nr:SANT/Myb-like DNA-binding domain-containing protein [Alphaproteobacteria bacterium]